MARGRFISESVAKDLRLNSLSVEAQLVYLMTVPHLDRDGMIEGDTDILYGTVCPKRRQFIDRMGDFIQEWEQVGLVIVYQATEGQVLYFKGFSKNQMGMRYDRETPSKFPPPPGYERSEDGLTCVVQTDADNIRQSAGDIRQSAGGVRELLAQVQVQVEVKDQIEVKGESVAPTATTPQQELFGAICEAVGWDYKTLSKDDKGQVAQLCGIFGKANYTVDDIRHFMVDIWFKDWRWLKEKQHPTLKQLRQEIGKLRSTLNGAAPQAKGIDGYRAMLARQGIEL